MRPVVSVIVPAFNSQQTIRPCLESLLCQTYQPLEVIVVDDGSTDDTVAVAQRYGVRVVRGGHCGAAAARNLGAQAASGKLLVFAESDAVYREDWVENLTAPLRVGDPGVGAALCGPGICWTDQHNLVVLYQDAKFEAITRLYEKGERVRGAWAYRREVFETLGGYDTSLHCGEDADLVWRAVRAGHRVEFGPRSEMRHKFPDTWRTFLRRAYWNGHQSIPLRAKRGFAIKGAQRVKWLCLALFLTVIPLGVIGLLASALLGMGWALPLLLTGSLLVLAALGSRRRLPEPLRILGLTMAVVVEQGRGLKSAGLLVVFWLDYVCTAWGLATGVFRYRREDLQQVKGGMAVRRVLLIEPLGEGGIHHYTHNLAEALTHVCGEVHVATVDGSSGEIKASRYRHHVIFRRVPRSWPRIVRKAANAFFYFVGWVSLFRLCLAVRPMVVHMQWLLWPTVDWLPLLLLGAKWPVVYTAHNPLPHERKWYHRTLYSLIYRMVNQIIVHSEHDADLIASMGVSTPVRKIPHGNYSFFKKALSSKGERTGKTVLYFGYIRPYKGLEYLIGCFPEVVRRFPATRLVIAGKPVSGFGRYELQIRANGIADQVDLRLGYLSDEEVAELFQRADILVLPYVEASQSGVLQIAIAFGLPVVATAVGGLPEVVEHNHSGLIVPSRDTEALGQAICMLLQDEKLRRSMGERARWLAEHKYDWDSIARTTLELYEGTTRSA